MPALELWTAALLLDISIKAALLATAAWIGITLFRIRSSHLQHRVWLLVLVGMLLLPALVHLAPSISLPHWLYPDLQLAAANVEPESVVPDQTVSVPQIKPEHVDVPSLVTPSVEPTPTSETIPAPSRPVVATNLPRAAPSQFAVPEIAEQPPIPLAPTLPEPQAEARTNSAAVAVLAIYLIGLAVQTLRLIIGMAWTRRLSHRARPIATPLAESWMPSWATLAESTELRVPVTIGYWRPVVMLPADWSTWSEEFLSMVLAHEAEHVRRRDTWSALLAALNTAVFWFHPVAWIVRRRLTDLAEQICDDEVIRITGNRGDYAQNLLAMAGRLTSDPRRLLPVGVAMARKANVVKRIEAIIDRDRPLSRRIGTLAALLLLTTVVPLVFLAAGLRATNPSEAAEAEAIVEEDADADSDSDTLPSAKTAGAQDGDRKFVYVLDRSLNMSGTEHSPLQAAKAELIASLDTLEDTQQFNIVVYNETPKTFNADGQQSELALATEQNKLRASQFVESIAAFGQPEHEAALKLAIRKQPHVIFLLTAGSGPQLSDRQLFEIQRRAAGIQINTIEFDAGPKQTGDNFLAKLARQNGGQYAYRDITKSADNAAEPDSSPKSLKGRVVMASDGTPVTGAEVKLRCWTPVDGHLDSKTCRTDAEGGFVFTNLNDGTYHATAYHENLTSRTRSEKYGVEVKLGDEAILLELHEAPAFHIAVVSKQNGQPIPGARVHVGSLSVQNPEYRCDANGEVLIQGLTSESWEVWTRAEGFARQRNDIYLAGTDTARLKVELEAGTELSGTVRDEDGNPLVDAYVTFMRPGSHVIPIGVKTDAQGKYYLENVPRTEVSVYVIVNEHNYSSFYVRPSEQPQFDVTMPRRQYGGAVRGIVVDPTGKPVQGATVTDRGASTGDIRRAESGEDGSFLIDGVHPRGLLPYRLLVQAKGFGPRLIPYTPGTKQQPAELDVTLKPGHSLRGRVVDADGTGITGVRVTVIPTGFERYWDRTDAILTDDEGRFEIDSLPADVHVECWKEGYSRTNQRYFPDMRNDIVVTMLSAGVIRGRVIDDNTEKPISPFTARLASYQPVLFTHPDGMFRFDRLLKRGNWHQLLVDADGYNRKVIPRAVAQGEDAEPLKVRLTPVDPSQLLTIAGRIVNETSQPRADAQVRLIVTSKPPARGERYPIEWSTIRSDRARMSARVLDYLATTTDGDGRFRFEGVRGGKHIELAYWGSGIAAAREECLEDLPPEEMANLAIRSRTSGNVRLQLDRAKFPEVKWIRVDGDREAGHGAILDQGDYLEIQDVLPGRCNLLVKGPYRESNRARDILKSIPIEIKPGETVTVDYAKATAPPSSGLEQEPKSKQPPPTTAPPDPDTANKPSSQAHSPSIPAPFTGRRPPRKQSLLQLHGGTARTTAAVRTGLHWLAQNQQEDGSWSLTGPYADGSRNENREAATAMALLAFQGDGNSTDYGEHQSVVKRGWDYLLKRQDSDGCFFRNGPFGHRFYTHGQATIAICELFAMTKDPKLRQTYKEPAQKAIAYCVRAQSPQGGWRYAPQASGDTSVTGWILMALHTARTAGLDVPDKTLAGVETYLDQIAQHGGSRYPYQKGREVTRVMTAEGLLCRQLLGWEPAHPQLREGVDWLLRPENKLSYADKRDVYYWYYATQTMFHMGGEPWLKWNRVMRQEVPNAQTESGPEVGSWHPAKPSQDEWGNEGGRLFVTCLSIYMLEAYYRHLPLHAEAKPTESPSSPDPTNSNNDKPAPAPPEQPTRQTVTGRIVNEQSQPVADVELCLMVVKKQPPAADGGISPYSAGSPETGSPKITPQTIRSGEARSSDRVQQFLATSTDREGRFHFEGVRTDNQIMLAYWGSNVSGEHRQLSQEDLNDLTIHARSPATVQITIDRDAFPLVDFYPSAGPPAGFIDTPKRTQNNSCEIHKLPPAHHGLSLIYRRPDDESDAPFRSIRIPMALSAGETVDIQVGAPWDFVVKDKAGNPLPGATVEYLCDRPYSLLPRKHTGKVTDKNGRVQLAVIEHNGPIGHVQVTATGYGTQRLPIRQSAANLATQTIQLRPVGRLEGQILSDDKTLIATATGYISQQDQAEQVTSGYAPLAIGDDGRFVVPEFAEGPARLVISTDEAPPLRPRGPESIEIRAGETTKVEIPLERTVYVRGIVQAKKDATPIANAEIMVLYDNLKGMSAAHTDENGRFSVNVLAGEVRQVLLRTPRKFSRWTKATEIPPIVIPAGAATFDLPPIEIAEQPGPVGRLIDRSIRPVSGARVKIVSEGQTIQSEPSDEDGAFVLELPATLPKLNVNRIEKIQVSLPDREAPLPATLFEGSMPFILQLDR